VNRSQLASGFQTRSATPAAQLYVWRTPLQVFAMTLATAHELAFCDPEPTARCVVLSHVLVVGSLFNRGLAISLLCFHSLRPDLKVHRFVSTQRSQCFPNLGHG
jgi:hypothetical protein